ncbi:MAG: hypothetical protein ACK5MF_08910 [Vibrio sp.]|uniref:hypothetical protein n=1 Tax=Vibrio sp. TaxID=678 RepID=UPI003A8C285C
MDSRQSQSEKMDDKAQILLTKQHDERPQPSRFSRRRFIQSGIGVSPLLLSVKSPAAWGCTNTTNPSITSRVSGNVSTNTGFGCLPKNPSAWLDILQGLHKEYGSFWEQLKNGGFNSRSSFLEALSVLGVHASTSFQDLFCNDLANWTSCSTKKNWRYKILTTHSDNITISEALKLSNCQTVLRVQHADSGNESQLKNSGPNAMGYNIMSSSDSKTFDIAISDFDLHKNLTCGFLNGILAPDVIAYDYTQRDIQNGFRTAIAQLADEVAQYGRKHSSIHSPCSILRDNLRHTWHDDDMCYS